MNEMRIASIACTGDLDCAGFNKVHSNLEKAGGLIKETCYRPTDLVVLPELFAWCGPFKNEEKRKTAEPLGGRFSQAMSNLAVKHRVNILSPLLERKDKYIYNSMVWYDRKGKITGVYRKAFPTDYEMAEGIRPGPLNFDAFETEFGPIGCCICFDINFREIIERLDRLKVKLVIFPTSFDGLCLMRAWAKLYRIFFVSASAYQYASAVDPTGGVLIRPWEHDQIMRITLNLDFVVLHTDYNRAKFPMVEKAYGSKVEIMSRDIEGGVYLSSRHPKKSAADIVREFKLEPEIDYYRRSSRLRDKKAKS